MDKPKSEHIKVFDHLFYKDSEMSYTSCKAYTGQEAKELSYKVLRLFEVAGSDIIPMYAEGILSIAGVRFYIRQGSNMSKYKVEGEEEMPPRRKMTMDDLELLENKKEVVRMLRLKYQGVMDDLKVLAQKDLEGTNGTIHLGKTVNGPGVTVGLTHEYVSKALECKKVDIAADLNLAQEDLNAALERWSC